MTSDRPERKPDRFPWYPHYVADWRLSRSVRQMTYEQRGMYRELMDVAWGDGTVEPCLTDDDRWIANELAVPLSRWKKVGGAVRVCWEARDGKLYSPRLSQAWEVQRTKYELRSQAGKLGGIAKAKAAERAGNASGLPNDSHGNARRFAGQTQKQIQKTAVREGPPTRLGAEVTGAAARLLGRNP